MIQFVNNLIARMPRLFVYFMVVTGICVAPTLGLERGSLTSIVWMVYTLGWLIIHERRETIWFNERLRCETYVEVNDQLPDRDLEEVRDAATRLLAAKRKKDSHPEVS